MKRIKKLKVKYVYIEPKTPQEKEEQQRKIDSAFDIIFRAIVDKSRGKNE